MTDALTAMIMAQLNPEPAPPPPPAEAVLCGPVPPSPADLAVVAGFAQHLAGVAAAEQAVQQAVVQAVQDQPDIPADVVARAAQRGRSPEAQQELEEATRMRAEGLKDLQSVKDYLLRLETVIREHLQPGERVLGHEPGVGIYASAVPTEIDPATLYTAAQLTPEQWAACFTEPKFSVELARKTLGDTVVDMGKVLKPEGKLTIKAVQ